MKILGIDPGSTTIGYAILNGNAGPSLLSCGLLTCPSATNTGRLKELSLQLSSLIKKWKPDIVAVEELFFSKNVKTALAVSEARGVILLTTALANITLHEYTPLEVKKIVTGDGGADKIQLKKMVRITLPETKNLQARDDVFDAIGISLACFFDQRHTFLRSQSPAL